MKQRPVPWVWKETEREPWAQLEEKPWTPQVSQPKLHLAGNSNPICTLPGSCRRDAPPLRWATWLFHLLFNSLVIWYVLGCWINFWTSLGFCLFFVLFLVVSLPYVNIDCSSHPRQKCNHGKFMGQVFRNHSEELGKKCVLYPLMLCLKNNRSQLGRCSLSAVQRD